MTKAGLTPWHQPFHAMRKTRQTELTDRGVPEHSVCRWLGNSVTVAREFYLKTTKESFDEAAAFLPSPKAAQIPAQYTSASLGNGSQRGRAGNEQTPVLQGFAVDCDSVRIAKVDDIGLEPTTSTMSTWRSNQLS